MAMKQFQLSKWNGKLWSEYSDQNILHNGQHPEISKDVKRLLYLLLIFILKSGYMVNAMNIFSNPGSPFSQFSYPGLEFCSDHFLDLFHGSSEFKFSPMLINSQLICLRPAGILNNVTCMFNLNYLFHLFAWPHWPLCDKFSQKQINVF